jgi:hypothetical protein
MTSQLPGYTGHIDRYELDYIPASDIPAHKYGGFEKRPSYVYIPFLFPSIGVRHAMRDPQADLSPDFARFFDRSLMDSAAHKSVSHSTVNNGSAYYPQNYSNGQLPPPSQYGLCHRPWTCPGHKPQAQESAAPAAGAVPVSAAFTQFGTLTTAYTVGSSDPSRGPGAHQWETTYNATLAAKRPAGSSRNLPRQDISDARSSTNDGLVHYSAFRGAGVRGPGFTRRAAGQAADPADAAAAATAAMDGPTEAATHGPHFAMTQSFGYTQRWSVPPRSLRPLQGQSNYRRDFASPQVALSAHAAAAAHVVGASALTDSYSHERSTGLSGFAGRAAGPALSTAQRGAALGSLSTTATVANMPYSSGDLMAGSSKAYPGLPPGYTGHMPALVHDSERHPAPGQGSRQLGSVDYISTIRRGVVGYTGHQPVTAPNNLAQSIYADSSLGRGAAKPSTSLYAPAASALPSAALVAPIAVSAVNASNNRANAVVSSYALSK